MDHGSEDDDLHPRYRPTVTVEGRLMWDDVIDAELISAWNDGLAATAIAERLARRYGVRVTRSAVIGRIHRLRIAGKAVRRSDAHAGLSKAQRLEMLRLKAELKAEKARAQRLAASIEAASKRIPGAHIEDPTPTPPPGAAVGVVDAVMAVTGCRWPHGDPRHPDFHFCDAPRVFGTSYCEPHLIRVMPEPRAYHPQTGLKAGRVSLLRRMADATELNQSPPTDEEAA